MGKGNKRFWLVFFVIAAVIMLSGSAGAWIFTASEPLLFEFDDNDNSVFTNPNTNNAYITYPKAPHETRLMNAPRYGGGTWQHVFSSAGTGSLTIQSVNSTAGRALTKAGSHASPNWTGVVSTLDWGKGFIAEIKSQCVGDQDPSTWPDGYNWSGNYGVGGFEYNWWNLLDNPSGAPAGSADSGLAFAWNTYDPTTTEDDLISLQNYTGGIYVSARYPLGGTPTSAPEHIYKLYIRRSPLPVQQQNDIVLATVYVDGVAVPGLINRTFKAPADNWGDGIQIGNRGFGPGGNQRRGDKYDYVKVWGADAVADTDNPSTPTVNATAESSSAIRIQWSASTDPTTSVIGYRIERNGVVTGYVEWNVTEMIDSGLTEETVYSYRVAAVDEAGNVSAWSSIATAATLPAPTITELTYNFNDIPGTNTYSYGGSPEYFYTTAAEDPSFYLGRKSTGTGVDGTVNYSANSRYQYTVTDADGGSLTLQTVTPAGQSSAANGSATITSNDFDSWFKWIRHPDYPSPGKIYTRGISFETEVEIVGDLNGWCAPWGDLPAIGGCPWDDAYGHFGSDWGSQWGNRAGVNIEVESNRDFDTPTHAGFGNTGNGVQMWVSVNPGDLTTPDDDEIRMYNNLSVVYSRFKFRDGLGLGLTPEDGRNPSHPRDGVITGDGNKLKLKIAICKAPLMPGYATTNNWEYWDIWVKRPIDDDYVHINPLTCDNLAGRPELIYGGGGHTVWSTYTSTRNRVTLGNLDGGNIWGMKFNWIKMRNDWDGNVIIRPKSLAELRKLAVGTQVVITPEGGEKIVTMDGNSIDMSDYFFFIEQEDRSFGIKVIDRDTIPFAQKGQQVSNLPGVLAKDADGNLCIDVTGQLYDFDTATKTIDPVGMNNLAAGGSNVTDGVGLGNTGLLATVWGRVSNVGYDGFGNLTFKLDDGSGTLISVCDPIFDGTSISPSNGQYWTVTGALIVKSDGAGGTLRAIIADSGRQVD